MKHKLLYYLILFLLVITSCEKQNENPVNLTVTGTAYDISEFTAKLSGYANPTPDMGTIVFGIIYSSDEKFGIAKTDTLITNVLDGNNMFVVYVTDLEAGQKYYYKSFIQYQGISASTRGPIQAQRIRDLRHVWKCMGMV